MHIKTIFKEKSYKRKLDMFWFNTEFAEWSVDDLRANEKAIKRLTFVPRVLQPIDIRNCEGFYVKRHWFNVTSKL